MRPHLQNDNDNKHQNQKIIVIITITPAIADKSVAGGAQVRRGSVAGGSRVGRGWVPSGSRAGRGWVVDQRPRRAAELDDNKYFFSASHPSTHAHMETISRSGTPPPYSAK